MKTAVPAHYGHGRCAATCGAASVSGPHRWVATQIRGGPPQFALGFGAARPHMALGPARATKKPIWKIV